MNIRLHRLLLLALALLLPGTALAGVLIDFDDLPYMVDPSDRCADAGPGSTCVTDQYQSLGITFTGLMLYQPEALLPPSPPNAVVNWAGPAVGIYFADWAQPDYVSFDAWTTSFGGVFARAYNAADQLVADIHVESEATMEKDGYWSTLAPTNIAVVAQGIQRIEIEALYNRRGNLHMDNIFFGDGPPVTVSEPSTLGLLLIAVLVTLLRLQRQAPARLWTSTHQHTAIPVS